MEGLDLSNNQQFQIHSENSISENDNSQAESIITKEYPVLKDLSGYVIGKQGMMIRKLIAETKCDIIIKNPEANNPNYRMVVLTGTKEKIDEAISRIESIVSQKKPFINRGPPPGTPGVYTVEYPVPCDKAGLVIGKSGDTINSLCAASGAFVEINKSAPQNSVFKSFYIRGTEPQIKLAKWMIIERIGGENASVIQYFLSTVGAYQQGSVIPLGPQVENSFVPLITPSGTITLATVPIAAAQNLTPLMTMTGASQSASAGNVDPNALAAASNPAVMTLYNQLYEHYYPYYYQQYSDHFYSQSTNGVAMNLSQSFPVGMQAQSTVSNAYTAIPSTTQQPGNYQWVNSSSVSSGQQPGGGFTQQQ